MHAQFDEAIRNALIVRIVFAPASEVSPSTLIARAWWREGSEWKLRRLEDNHLIRIRRELVESLEVVGVCIDDYEF